MFEYSKQLMNSILLCCEKRTEEKNPFPVPSSSPSFFEPILGTYLCLRLSSEIHWISQAVHSSIIYLNCCQQLIYQQEG